MTSPPKLPRWLQENRIIEPATSTAVNNNIATLDLCRYLESSTKQVLGSATMRQLFCRILVDYW